MAESLETPGVFTQLKELARKVDKNVPEFLKILIQPPEKMTNHLEMLATVNKIKHYFNEVEEVTNETRRLFKDIQRSNVEINKTAHSTKTHLDALEDDLFSFIQQLKKNGLQIQINNEDSKNTEPAQPANEDTEECEENIPAKPQNRTPDFTNIGLSLETVDLLFNQNKSLLQSEARGDRGIYTLKNAAENARDVPKMDSRTNTTPTETPRPNSVFESPELSCITRFMLKAYQEESCLQLWNKVSMLNSDDLEQKTDMADLAYSVKQDPCLSNGNTPCEKVPDASRVTASALVKTLDYSSHKIKPELNNPIDFAEDLKVNNTLEFPKTPELSRRYSFM